jgi:hypothetical protein
MSAAWAVPPRAGALQRCLTRLVLAAVDSCVALGQAHGVPQHGWQPDPPGSPGPTGSPAPPPRPPLTPA